MEEKDTKEINLLELISIFLNWLKNLTLGFFNFLGYILRLCYRHILLVIFVMVLSIVVGQYLSRSSARIYKVEAMAMICGSDAQTVKDISRQLENASAQNPLMSLSKKLSLNDSVSKNIINIMSFYVIDYMRDSVADIVDFKNNHSLSDTMNVRMKDRIYFRVQTRNIAQVPIVQEALLNYFNNNKVLRTQYENKREEFTKQISICDLEMKRLDSLAQVSYFKDNKNQLQLSNNQLIVGEQRKQLFYQDMLDIQKIKAETEDKLILYTNPLVIPSGLVVIPVAINSSLKYGVYSILIGLLISIILSLLIESYPRIFTYLKS